MHNIISAMMAGVKEQKVNHLKSLKKLTNEKNILTKKFKDLREVHATSKVVLDQNMKTYQSFQRDYDSLDVNAEESLREEIEMKMADLLTTIERDRGAWMQTRDSLKVHYRPYSSLSCDYYMSMRAIEIEWGLSRRD